MIPSAPALLLLSLLHILAAENPRHFRIGGVLSSPENEQTFNKTIQVSASATGPAARRRDGTACWFVPKTIC